MTPSLPDPAPPRIRVLPPELASQIAAGEVVERPASVVKELAENALDAGARRLRVELQGGGTRLIRVVDDGAGMTAAEADLALRRHATSKLARVEDLAAIATLGFRGEALPSIASVSRLTLTTRTADALEGTRLRVEGGETLEQQAVGCPAGTTLEVADLFYNVPARRKFLKTERTEAAHVSDALLHLALAWPELHVTLVEDGRVTLDLPRHPGLVERAEAGLGRRGGRLHPVTHVAGDLRVTAALGGPDQAASTARNVYLMVNRRAVRDRLLLRALAGGYGELLERGRYPLAVLHLELPVDQVDVNVHPQKLEVRFVREHDVARALHEAVARAVLDAPWARASGLEAAPPRRYALHRSPAPSPSPAPGSAPSRPGSTVAETFARYAPSFADRHAERLPRDPVPVPVPIPAPAPAEPGTLAACRYLGQALGTYLVLEGDGELLLVDQHAGHERITYARLREGLAAGAVPGQRLLFPITVPLQADEEEALREQAPLVARLGFEVELLSGRTAAVRAVPAPLAGADPASLVRDVVAELAHGPRSDTLERGLDHLAATLACHGSVRAGAPLAPPEVAALLRDLDRVERSGHCPHGRPVLVRLSGREIRRRFGRE